MFVLCGLNNHPTYRIHFQERSDLTFDNALIFTLLTFSDRHRVSPIQNPNRLHHALQKVYLIPLTCVFSFFTPFCVQAKDDKKTSSFPNARFLRITVPGDNKILTLNEVEIYSAGKNLARAGKATQSSTGTEEWPRGQSTGTRTRTTTQEDRPTRMGSDRSLHGGRSTWAKAYRSKKSKCTTARVLNLVSTDSP